MCKDRMSTQSVVQPGKGFCGWSFTSIGGQTRQHIGRIGYDATADSFDRTRTMASVQLAVQADGKILVGGAFHGANSIGDKRAIGLPGSIRTRARLIIRSERGQYRLFPHTTAGWQDAGGWAFYEHRRRAAHSFRPAETMIPPPCKSSSDANALPGRGPAQARNHEVFFLYSTTI